MKLNELKPNEGSRHDRKRVDRGISSGHGKATGRGQRGQSTRTDGKTRLGSEGGQMPLFRRTPKRGFKSINREEYVIINLNDLNRLDGGSEVTTSILKSLGSVKKELARVKSLINGELKVRLTVKANKVLEAAKKAVEATGGTVEVI